MNFMKDEVTVEAMRAFYLKAMKEKTRANNKQSMQGSAAFLSLDYHLPFYRPALIRCVLAMEHDASDILGHSSLPVARGKNSGPSSFSMGQFVFIGVVLFVIYMVAKRLWKRALLWQERSYKL